MTRKIEGLCEGRHIESSAKLKDRRGCDDLSAIAAPCLTSDQFHPIKAASSRSRLFVGGSDAENLWWLPLRCRALRVQCRTNGNGDLPLHALSKSVWFGILGERRRSGAEFDMAGTESRLLR